MQILQKTMEQLGGYFPRLLAAVAVLVFGWLIAWAVYAVFHKGLHRANLDERISKKFGGTYRTEYWVARSAFWVIMLLAIIAFFSVLQLPPISQSLQNVADRVLGFLPRVIAAGVLFLVAWVLAGTVRFIITRTLSAAKFDERFTEKAQISEEGRVAMSKALGNIVYWLIFLIFLPAILSTLALEGILTPVQQMVEKIIAFLPNIFVAGLILLAGWFLARIIRRIVTGILAAVGTDRLSEKIGLTHVMKPLNLSNVLGLVVYIFILIPIVIASLDALKLEGITRPASVMLEKILAAAPVIFAAVLVLAIAYVVGRLAGRLVANLLMAANIDNLPAKFGFGEESVSGQWKPSEIAGHLIVVAVMLFAFTSSLNILGFDNLAEVFTRFLFLLGHILMGLIIFAFGLYIANLASRVIKSRKLAAAEPLALTARIAILILAGAMALRQMGLANEIITIAFGLALGAVAIAAAIAFGIGGREIAARKLGEWTKSFENRKFTKNP